MKRPRTIAAILLLSIAFVCFISAPVLSGGGDPWDVDGDAPDDGSGSDDGDGGVDPFTDEETDQIDDGYNPDWLSGLAFGWTYQFITYVLGDEDTSSDSMRVVEEESGGHVAAQ